jgi:CheY-like chemotaxis protein
MPDMNGIELAERIRNHDNTMPVIVMTGYPSLENAIQTIKNGVVDFLIKPIKLKQMELCVQRVMQQRKMFAENVLLKKEVEGKQRLQELNKELLIKVKELNILNKIMNKFAAISSSTDVFKRAVDIALDISHADYTHFYVINEAIQEPVNVSSSTAESAGSTAFPNRKTAYVEPQTSLTANLRALSDTLIMEVVSDQIPLLISEHNGSNGLPAEINSAMIVPLKIRDKVFGVITAIVSQGQKRFAEKDLYYLSFLAQSAAQAIENLVLYENIYENLFATLYAYSDALKKSWIFSILPATCMTSAKSASAMTFC